jgi:serine/threonine-protein kinase HipA
MSRCLICLGDIEPAADTTYHGRCVRQLFGTATVPAIDLEMAKLHTVALAMVGRVSLSGIQRKISLGLTTDRRTLQVAVGRHRYILKPQTDVYPALPENEHVTMKIAQLVGIDVPPCGLVRLRDGSVAFITERFDRPREGGKLRQEDFCQLAEKPPKDKYDGSGELCARLVRKYASEPGIEIWRLYRLLLCSWWSGNGDMHLKNFSLLADRDGRHQLSPAYDLLATRLVIPDDPLALPIGGKRDGLVADDWRRFAEYCRLPERAALRIHREIIGATDGAMSLLTRSMLPDDLKEAYRAVLRERTGVLQAA